MCIAETIFEPRPVREETTNEIVNNTDSFSDFEESIYKEEVDCTPWNWYISRSFATLGQFAFLRLFEEDYWVPPVSAYW